MEQYTNMYFINNFSFIEYDFDFITESPEL